MTTSASLNLPPTSSDNLVEEAAGFGIEGNRQRWRESYPKDGTKADDAIIVFTGVPTMYTRLIQGYEAMDPELQEASASAASKLCLMPSACNTFFLRKF
ncbi:hypothetical protein ACSBR2_016444 [Camellia fascicularis]